MLNTLAYSERTRDVLAIILEDALSSGEVARIYAKCAKDDDPAEATAVEEEVQDIVTRLDAAVVEPEKSYLLYRAETLAGMIVFAACYLRHARDIPGATRILYSLVTEYEELNTQLREKCSI